MKYTSLDFLKFLLFDVHKMPRLFELPRFAHLDLDSMELLIDTAKDWADRELHPFFREMDEKPVKFEPFTDGRQGGKVSSHPQLRSILRGAGESGWIGCAADFDDGGAQLPETMFGSIQHIFQAANNGAQGYIALTSGAANLIKNFGSPELKARFVPKMFAGEWQGTMALTEPQAGSSLSDVTASATPANAEHYLVKGHKIFISGGDHEGADNFVHLTLARIDGAPVGTKGISLFVIPKFREENGQFHQNDVLTAGDFQKLGQRGYATTHLVFGENNDCHAYLVGEPHRGLHYMFQMMNEARLGVGMTAGSVAQAAFYASLQYARERPQGRPASNKNPAAPPVPIIQHADVRRLLLTQKVIAEGTISLGTACGILADLAHAGEGETKKEAFLLLEILTPILKAYGSEQGARATALAIQTLGGYGYTIDFPQQQFFRDIRIMSIYEGTTGIQSLDLLGRKMTMENGAAYKILLREMAETIDKALTINELQPQADVLKKEIDRLNQVVTHLSPLMFSGKIDAFLADATVFMEQISLVVIGWQWLKMAVVAEQKGRFSTAFYEGKKVAMQFFMQYELPHASACARTLLANQAFLTLNLDESVLD
jgi:alkylation response protein AidB-like acyl-CoA dehydrogenase